MLQAVLLQKKSRSPLIENLENDFAFTRVNNVAALKKQLFKKEFDFVFIAEKDVLQLMQSVLTVYELDKELPIIAHDSPEIYNKIPFTDNLYFVPLRVTNNHIFEVLSFHQAKVGEHLQAVYQLRGKIKPHPFYLSEHSPLGIILTDAENSIFYANDQAKRFLNFDPQLKQLTHYLGPTIALEEPRNPSQNSFEKYFDSLLVSTSASYLNVHQNIVTSKKNTLGYIYFLDDASQKQKQEQQIKREKAKYERLTGRLNEVLLHELDTQAYNLSYFKRKLDLEIRRAHKGVHDVCLFYFAIDPLDQIITDHKIKKHIIINTTSCLLEKFPDPYIVGHVDNGQWLVIATSDFLHVGSDVPAIASQLTEHLNHELSSQGLAAVAQITSRVIKDLKSFKNSDDVLETVGSDSIL